jgi:DNA recombination protein RmuC
MESLWLAIGFVIGGIVIGGTVAWTARVTRKSLVERCAQAQSDLSASRSAFALLQKELLQMTAALATAEANLNNASLRTQEHEEMHGRLKLEFENLANRILDEKSARFTSQNQTNLNQLLSPLATQITEFKSRVEQVYTAETAERATLRTQIENLSTLNQQMTEDARNLTLALKGDSKAQGNWGELILEKVLEGSGLTQGVEYTTQTNLKNEHGANLRPDVIIRLPEGKHFVVDSKVSLSAYERYCSATGSDVQQLALREHARSVRSHFQSLAGKKYQDLYQISAPDFVFMFIPIEPAFGRALESEPALFNDAFEQGVILVTPSTLLATLRTVAQIWKQEKQTRNSLEIARKSGALYDKFVGLYEDLEKVHSKLEETSRNYRDALDKIKDGRGNLIKRVQDIKKLGARTEKEFSPEVVRASEESDALEAGDEPAVLGTNRTLARPGALAAPKVAPELSQINV